MGTEHLLLGLLKVEDGRAARILGQLGVGYDAARAGVVEWIKGYLASNPEAVRRVAEAKQQAGAAGIRLEVAGDEES